MDVSHNKDYQAIQTIIQSLEDRLEDVESVQPHEIDAKKKQIQEHFDECITSLIARRDDLMIQLSELANQREIYLLQITEKLKGCLKVCTEILIAGTNIFTVNPQIASQIWQTASTMQAPVVVSDELSMEIGVNLPKSLPETISSHGAVFFCKSNSMQRLLNQSEFTALTDFENTLSYKKNIDLVYSLSNIGSSAASSSTSFMSEIAVSASTMKISSPPFQILPSSPLGTTASLAAMPDQTYIQEIGGVKLLSGEVVQHAMDKVDFIDGYRSTGKVTITNYRLIFCSADSNRYFNRADVPLCMIEKIKSNFGSNTVDIYCKDTRRIRLSCTGLANELKKRIPDQPENFFAFSHKEVFSAPGWDVYYAEIEYKRIGLIPSDSFRLTRANKDYTLCSTYPAELIVPSVVTDEMLIKVATYHMNERIPAVTWMNHMGVPIIRCSPPSVASIIPVRCIEDEILLKALHQGNKKLYLLDTRTTPSALENIVAKRGYDASEYSNTEILFMNIASATTLKGSLDNLTEQCLVGLDSSTNAQWLTALEATRWIEHVQGLISAANTLVHIIDKISCPAVVHGSSGENRTSQVIALAELLLDPFYRTIYGFEILIEKDWLSFGHMFGYYSEPAHFAPVFLLFLSAVYNVIVQIPTSCEFNENFLITIADELYNGCFGTFLFNSEKERNDNSLKSRTVSLWAYINANKRYYTNPHYNPHLTQVLYPTLHYPQMVFWKGYFLRYTKSYMHDVQSRESRMWQLLAENESLKNQLVVGPKEQEVHNA